MTPRTGRPCPLPHTARSSRRVVGSVLRGFQPTPSADGADPKCVREGSIGFEVERTAGGIIGRAPAADQHLDGGDLQRAVDQRPAGCGQRARAGIVRVDANTTSGADEKLVGPGRVEKTGLVSRPHQGAAVQRAGPRASRPRSRHVDHVELPPADGRLLALPVDPVAIAPPKITLRSPPGSIVLLVPPIIWLPRPLLRLRASASDKPLAQKAQARRRARCGYA
jgi:hypothetical protein